MKNRILLIEVLLATAITASAQLTYADAKIKADRFFGYKEWASAAVLYNYMIDKQPDVTDTYGRAIVSNALVNDTIRSMDLLSEAMAHNIPLDSILTQVKKYAFEVGHSNLYEHFMLQGAKICPWLERPLDSQLLKYYAFRSNGPKMIEYANIMLKGAPDNPNFMLTLAKGYMLQNHPQEALKIWRKLVTLDPRNYDALLNLANFYHLNNAPVEALAYFEQAQAIRPTPYVQQVISSLKDRAPK